ncbi:DNA alkylation repair protein [Lysobacter sp. LF1]|uniref:DNA alkylation repair protein n=1 Tax=Lysobacter stagni TaxID=3045172 RepID=A0ABT6XIM9_9GAMM|nr:DNA alkylation repair protein [Lysobacter sp. LF1]MDI9240013.1 DNA alkylation repair protein [Lysobacter sp. LF1]
MSVDEAVEWLRRHASHATRDGMARFAIPTDHALGVGMKDIQSLAKQAGRDHALAQALWDTGIYEARTLAAYVAEPELLTAAQMDRWCRDFDNWAICDTLCFVLFDRTPHAWRKVDQWASRRDEFQKRAAFALLASLALHGRGDAAAYRRGLALVEREAGDERNFVRKGASWALRSLGRRDEVREAGLELAQRLSTSDVATERWLGKDALRDLRKADARKAATKKTAVKKVAKTASRK